MVIATLLPPFTGSSHKESPHWFATTRSSPYLAFRSHTNADFTNDHGLHDENGKTAAESNLMGVDGWRAVSPVGGIMLSGFGRQRHHYYAWRPVGPANLALLGVMTRSVV